MYNYLMLVGYISKDIELKETADGKTVAQIDMAIKRDFKNAEGTYDCDFVRVTLWGFAAQIAKQNFSVGNKVGIKGRVYPHTEQLASGAFVPINELVGERIIFFDKNNNAEAEISSDDEASYENTK